MLKPFCWILFLCILSFNGPVLAATYYASPAGSDSSGNGSSSNPWRTITKAVNNASSGDTVLVAASTYNTANGETFPIEVTKSLTIEGASWGTTLIEGTKAATTGYIFGISALNVTITEFKIKGIGSSADGAAAYFKSGSSGKVSKLIIDGENNGTAGILVQGADVTITNVVIYGCKSGGSLSAGAYLQRGNIEMRNCTIADNKDNGVFISGDQATVQIRNSIIANNEIGILVDQGPSSTVSFSYNNVWGNVVDRNGASPGTGDTSGDPLFVSTSEGNYRLRSRQEGYLIHSSCIDAGDPSSDYSQEPSPNGSRINMGAYGGTSQAELSFSPTLMKTKPEYTTAILPTKTIFNPKVDANLNLQLRTEAGALPANKIYKLVIVSMRGQIVYQKEFAFPGGEKVNLTIPRTDFPQAGELPAGIYQMFVVADGKIIGKNYFTVKPW